ncbi:MAG: hypothetical protein IPN26_00005 [Bacteroidetes bacterium]|nr:hypothetical protein [Bacteroidota bacterium]
MEGKGLPASLHMTRVQAMLPYALFTWKNSLRNSKKN